MRAVCQSCKTPGSVLLVLVLLLLARGTEPAACTASQPASRSQDKDWAGGLLLLRCEAAASESAGFRGKTVQH